MISRATKPMGEAGNRSKIDIGGKDRTIVSAFHPSTFAKDVEKGSLSNKAAVKQAALLEFCFLRAVNIAFGTDVSGSGLPKLRAMAL